MRPYERTFDQWRDLYFESGHGSDDAEEALDNMRITAEFSEHWSELFRIATEEERLSPGHPFAAICSSCIGIYPSMHAVTMYKSNFARWKMRIYLLLWKLALGPGPNICGRPVW